MKTVAYLAGLMFLAPFASTAAVAVEIATFVARWSGNAGDPTALVSDRRLLPALDMAGREIARRVGSGR